MASSTTTRGAPELVYAPGVRCATRISVTLLSAPLGLAVACGAFDSDEPASSPDGGLDAAAADGPSASSSGDGGDGAASGRCDAFATFSSPSPLAGIVDANEVALQTNLSADEKTLYFFRAGLTENVGRIVMSTRGTTVEPFGRGVVVAVSPDGGTYASPAVTPDALTILLTETRVGSSGGGPSQRIVRGTRADSAGTFGGFATLSELDGLGSFTTTPALARGGLVLYVTSGPSETSRTVRRGTRAALDVPFSGFTELPLGAPGEELSSPVPSEDDEVLFFSKRMAGSNQYALYVARRTSPGGAFGAPRAVTELQTKEQVFPGWISPDLCRLYFSAGAAYPNVTSYVATRRP